MKITITLDKAEVQGIKAYLKSMEGDLNYKVTKQDIQLYISSIVDSTIHSTHESVSDYINHFKSKES